MPIVCRSLGLETFLLPIKADNLKKLENGGNIDEVLEIDSKDKYLKVWQGLHFEIDYQEEDI